MKQKYKVEVELENKQIVYKYTYATNQNQALCNIAWNLENKEGEKMFNFRKVEVETKPEEIKEEEKEVIKLVSLKNVDGEEQIKAGKYYASNMGKVYSMENDTLTELKVGNNGGNKSVSLRKNDGESTTYNISSLVYRTFNNMVFDDTNARLRLNFKDGNKDNVRLSNLEPIRKEKVKDNKKLEEALKEISKEELIEIINRVYK